MTRTPERVALLDEIGTATAELSRLAAISSWAAKGATLASRDERPHAAMDTLFMAMEWVAGEVERRCSVIDEALSQL